LLEESFGSLSAVRDEAVCIHVLMLEHGVTLLGVYVDLRKKWEKVVSAVEDERAEVLTCSVYTAAVCDEAMLSGRVMVRMPLLLV
jgi:hypothetical protein